MRNFILLFTSFCILNSCVSIKPISEPISNEPKIIEKQLTPFPLLPALKEYTRKPVIESKDNNNFLVSDELVNNSILMKKSLEKIKNWKDENKIK